jgi:hypothetical protein
MSDDGTDDGITPALTEAEALEIADGLTPAPVIALPRVFKGGEQAPQPDPRRPRGFMTLGLVDGGTILIRVCEVALVAECAYPQSRVVEVAGGHSRVDAWTVDGARLTMRSGVIVDASEKVGEVAAFMNEEGRDA